MKLTEEQRIILDGEIALALLRFAGWDNLEEVLENRRDELNYLCNTAIENFLASC